MYAPLLELIRASRLAGKSFHEIQQELLARASANALAKSRVKKPEIFGIEAIIRAHLGKSIAVKASLSWPFHDLAVMDAIRSAMPADTQAVVDIGCGGGQYLSQLAAGDLSREYFGAEISESGLECVREWALCLGQANIRPAAFDIGAPDFGFIPKSRVFAYSVGALVYGPVTEDFFQQLFSRSMSCKCLLLEPISYQIPSVEHPLFPRSQAETMGHFDGLYGVLKALRNAGKINIERIVPDYTGPTALASYTLIEFSAV